MAAAQPRNNLDQTLSYLIRTSDDGSWPYKPGGAPSLEATAWASIALRHQSHARLTALQYLTKTQLKDGGWSTTKLVGEADWNSYLAALALRILLEQMASRAPGGDGIAARLDGELRQTINFIVDERVDFGTPLTKIIVFLLKPELLDQPKGWPWSKGCFHWVEPTSYVLTALKPSYLTGIDNLAHILKKAEDYLLNCACESGGWNYGNNFVNGVELPAYPVTTAQALIALQDRASEKTVKRALSYLLRVAPEQHTVLALSWCVMALEAFGEKIQPLYPKLLALKDEDGAFGSNLLQTALASCALQTFLQDNPLSFKSHLQEP